MKIRIKGNSIRVRVTQSELARLMSAGRVEDTIHFAPGETHQLTFALERDYSARQLSVRHKPGLVTIAIPSADASTWSDTDQVGLEGTQDVGAGESLRIVVEKDFACLEARTEDADAFPNPARGASC